MTSLELLSPANKVGEGFDDYVWGRDNLLCQSVHLVELDLLRGGRRMPMGQHLPPGDYYAMVSRDELRPDCEVYAWTIRDPLPRLPITLQDPDPDILLALADPVALAYERGL